jgi:uncharacterized membrane protein
VAEVMEPSLPPDRAEEALDAVATETPASLETEPAPDDAGVVARAALARNTAELAPLRGAAITILTWGFRTGGALLAVGLLLAAIKQESLSHQAGSFTDVIPAILDGRAGGVVDLAILWIMATPVATVIVIATGFFRLGDRRYGALSLAVLAVLCVSISLSLFL